jgi:hypothetical protein
MSRFHQVRDPADNPRLGSLYKEIVDHGLGANTPINWFTAQSARPDILATTVGNG